MPEAATWGASLVAVGAESLLSGMGAVLLFLRKTFLERGLLVLVSFAAGALLGDAFLHILPEAFGLADSLESMLQSHGVAVYLEAEHLCTQMRGVEEVAQLTRTTFWRGAYFDDPSLRSEFFVACGLTR